MKPDDLLEKKLPGIQLALFELIWPSFDWIKAVYVASSSNQCSVHVQAAHLPSHVEWDDCARLLGELFDAVLADTKLHLDLTHDKSLPAQPGYREVMSQDIFKTIAKDVAPWRLDAGR